MAEEMKKIDNEELGKVDGGMAAAYAALKEDLKEMIPAEVREKLRYARGDVDVCRILAENDIDVEAIEKRIGEAGFNQIKIGLQELPDEALDMIAGGSASSKTDFACKCGNDDREEFSIQFWRSAISTVFDSQYDLVYRCKKCNTYVACKKAGGIDYIDE